MYVKYTQYSRERIRFNRDKMNMDKVQGLLMLKDSSILPQKTLPEVVNWYEQPITMVTSWWSPSATTSHIIA